MAILKHGPQSNYWYHVLTHFKTQLRGGAKPILNDEKKNRLFIIKNTL